jgi:hypothetical protein
MNLAFSIAPFAWQMERRRAAGLFSGDSTDDVAYVFEDVNVMVGTEMDEGLPVLVLNDVSNMLRDDEHFPLVNVRKYAVVGHAFPGSLDGRFFENFEVPDTDDIIR